MFTAREATKASAVNDTRDCASINNFAILVKGIVSVGLNAVAFVADTYK